MSKALCPQFQENPILRVENESCTIALNMTVSKLNGSMHLSCALLRYSPRGGALGYFLGGYVPPGTPNWHPVLKKNFPNIDTPF